ncbi:hypothetical protein [Longirhabdus pacifica]|uniref:hypothetical protein n=1 Tax=Longirhabdus pacifica TaxID=2305227 RepID=UPI0010091DCD|nr:hypothetical protein [Longirhabdus pacifica]
MYLQKYVGDTVALIYINRDKEISHRYIRIKAIKENGTWIQAYCYRAKGPRTFQIRNILAWQPAKYQCIK